MSIPPGHSDQSFGNPPAGYPTGGPQPYQPSAASQGTSGLAIAGLVLAFLFAPLGFILSLIAFFTTGKGRKKGKGLAAAGLVISLVLMGIGGVLAVTVFRNAATIVDAGCTQGKAVILANADLGGGTDPAVTKAKLQTLITGLDKAASSAKDAEVRAAMTALGNDYRQLLQAVNSGDVPAGLQAKIGVDATKIDELCTLGGAEE